jgi:hypothetical protein
MNQRAPFDPSDPFDAMADQFRTQVADMAVRAYKAAIYRDLTPTKQLECFLSGVMTGMVGVAFASIDEAGRYVMMDYIQEFLPAARELAEGIMSNHGG